jgi:hypothetical protein
VVLIFLKISNLKEIKHQEKEGGYTFNLIHLKNNKVNRKRFSILRILNLEKIKQDYKEVAFK